MLETVLGDVSYLGNRDATPRLNPIPATNGGAVSAILPHPTNSSVIWIGSVNGGVWKTEDGGINWRPLTDSLPSLSISHLSFVVETTSTTAEATSPTYSTTKLLASVGLMSKNLPSG